MVGLSMGADSAEYAAALQDGPDLPPSNDLDQENTQNKMIEDAISALVNLGYQRIEAYQAVNKAAGQGGQMNVSSLIKAALKEFANKEN